jgi:prepilin-type N-terminal cleavage/methylation domain-containing protein
MHTRARAGFTLVELMVVIAILGLLVSVLAFSVTRHFTKANADLDKVNMSKLFSAVQSMANEPKFNRRLDGSRDKSGREFFQACFRANLLDRDQVKQVVSLGGPDSAPRHPDLDKDFELHETACSFTAPKMGELKHLLQAKHPTVLFAFNSGNWHNYDSIDYGVLVAWSDGEVGYLTQDEAAEKWNITPDEWADPKQLIGKKAPFDHTFE